MSATYMIAVTPQDSDRICAVLAWDVRSAQFITTPDRARTWPFNSHDDAQQLASDFNDYWTTKGRTIRAHVAPFVKEPT